MATTAATMSCSGSHLGIMINIKNTKFVKDLPMIDAQFRFNQCNSFREEDISVFSRGGPLPKLCPAFQNYDQDGHHSRT
jgi:hypothetical protein